MEVLDALIQAVRCQNPREAIASIDSALHLGLVEDRDLDDLFRALPCRYRALRRFVDGRAESGTETLMRLLLRGLGVRIELQMPIEGVGRVDLLVNGWLIVECDSRSFHGAWEDRKRDLRRDSKAAGLGYTTLRVLAEDVMWHREEVLAAAKGLLAGRRRRRG